MISRKRINKIAEKAVAESFKSGVLQEKLINQFSKEFSGMPKTQAIPLLSTYLKGLKRELGKQTLVIETALPLPQNKVSMIEKSLKNHRHISSTIASVNPGLLGGIKIKIADEVYEGSLLRQIEDLGRIIANG